MHEMRQAVFTRDAIQQHADGLRKRLAGLNPRNVSLANAKLIAQLTLAQPQGISNGETSVHTPSNTDRIFNVNTIRIEPRARLAGMTMNERLKTARKAAGFLTAAEAARAINHGVASYTHHENGTRKFLAEAERYARFFRVDLDWLLTGRGDMRGKRASIPVMGVVSAGSSVIPISDPAGDPEIDQLTLPERGKIAALIVKGDSMYPRFLDGEALLYDPTPTNPAHLLNCYAVAQTLDGRTMIKKLKPARKNGHYTLWSHNAPEEEVELLTAHRVLGMLT